ncbi:hypothetical protein HUE87_08805 [Candidatus Sulfurimonas marisnigri]|uniref:GGDEF domain-containing protein n=1 Tax=Candidatus Sulfurimonas marisnigri TaxID=2740405 RepID=A0A7S7LYY3_9BACT|nr:hypothetical protein [Candidatus Sulfurimonas marisnigri]QOY53991.1 hypothetical protein HUE87_08805 [Candidatus Sulfurimonas marisnigri]
MLNKVKNSRQQYHEKIISNLQDYSYRNKRYSIEFALAFGLCDDSNDFYDFVNSKRKTDKVIALEDNLCCVIIDCVSKEDAIKATSNLVHGFKSKKSKETLYSGVVSSIDYENDANIVASLLDILEYSISNDMKGLITDKDYMGHSV